jgi:hypothetical protein
MAEPLIRREPRASNGWNNGDLDVAMQLFACGMVWDGNLASKSSRDHLVANGFAVCSGGMQSLTGRGVLHFLTTPAVWRSVAIRRWRWGRNPLVADEARIRRAMEA